MKRFPQSQWLIAGFGVATVLMAIVNGFSYQNAMQLIESTNRSRQTYGVIKNLIDIFTDMTVAESGRRGYIYLGDEQERIRSETAIAEISAKINWLETQLAENSRQSERLNRLETLLDQRIALLEESISLHQRDHGATSAQQQITIRSVALRGDIQTIISRMQQEEEQALAQWLEETQSTIRTRILIETLVSLSSFAILVAVSLLLYWQLLERQKAEASKASLEKEKELSDLKLRFFSMVSHEFRTPLSIILGSSQLLAEGNSQWTEERRLKNIQRIQSSAQLMTRYLTDILTLTRAEAGNLGCKPEALDVESFCLNLVDELQFTELNQHTIQFHSEGFCGLVRLDEKLLYSILSNLLLNAMKYSDPGSIIQLVLQCSTTETTFLVKDAGIGMSETDQQKLYQPFYRGENASDIKGTGLGLAVVKKCVDLHGGAIVVESKVGIGTTFRVSIPNTRSTL